MAVFHTLESDDELDRAARKLGFENAFDDSAEAPLPSEPVEVISQSNATAIATWDYQNYLLLTFVDKTRALPVIILAYECDPRGRVEDWSSRLRLETDDIQAGYYKLRWLIANDLAEIEFLDDEFMKNLRD